MASQQSGVKVIRSVRLISPKGRLSYPHLFKPTAFQGEGEPKFSCSIYIDKTAGKQFVADVKKLQEKALKELYPEKFPQNLERWGISDGDEGEDQAAKGCWIIKSSNKSRPAVLDADGTEILEELAAYGGCYGRVNICAKAYGTTSKGGVTLELNVFQKIADGEPFGGAEKAKQSAMAEMGAYEEEEF